MSRAAHPSDPGTGPTGSGADRREVMTLVFTDLVGSTRLKEELGNTRALALILEHHSLVRSLLREYPAGFEISTAGDSFFLAFRRPSDAVAFALRLQSRVEQWNRNRPHPLLDRIGVHAGEVTVEEDASGGIRDLHGLEVDKCARVMSLGRANHILLTRFAFENARASLKGQSIPDVAEVLWHSHGLYQLKGVSEPLEICEVAEAGRTSLEPPPDSDKVKRVALFDPTEANAVEARGWRRWWAGHRVSRRGAWIGGGLAACVGLLTLIVPVFDSLSHLSYDLAYLFHRVDVPTEAAIIRMDRPSHDQLGQPWMQAWNRRLHATLIDRLRAFGARAIVFDILFDQPSADDPAGDEALVAAARRHGAVAVAGVMVDDSRQGVVIGSYTQGPFPALAEVTRWGLVEQASADLTVRRAYPGTTARDSLARETVRMLGKEPSPHPGNTWLRYYGPPNTVPSYSYSEVLTNLIPATQFTNKLVFVGAVYDLGFTGGKGTDDFRTPYSRWTGRRSPGVEVVATSTLNQWRGDWLVRLPPWIEVLLVVTTGLAFGFGLARFRPLPAMILATTFALLVAVVAPALVWSTGRWFPWLIVAAVQLPLACAWSIVLWTNGPAPSPVRTARRGTAPQPASTPLPAPDRPRPDGPAATAVPRVAVDAAAPTGAGRLHIDHYQLLHPIGAGSYGQVWLARDAVGVLRAIKVIQRQAFSSDEPYDREFAGLRQFTPLSLLHPALIHILHVGRDDTAKFFYCVMEAADDRVAGPNLPASDYLPRTLAEDLKTKGHLPTDEVVSLGLELAGAIGFLHDHRLVHRDIKPSNILFVRGQPKLGDIGLVTAMASTDREVTWLGTRGYLPPEGPGRATADIYALGKLLYVAATGRDPQEFPEHPPDIDQRPDRDALLALTAVWLKACDPDPGQRQTSAAAVAADLAALRRTPASGAGDPSCHPAPPPARNPA